MRMLAQWLSGTSVINTDAQQVIMKSLGLCEIDASSGKITSVNARVCELMARSEQELVGSRFGDYCSDNFLRSQINAYISDSVRASQYEVDTVLTMAYSPVASDLRWFNLRFNTMNSLQSKNKVSSSLLVLITDETDRHSHDLEQRTNKAYANALEQCQANVMLADNDMRIIYMNKAIKTMLKAREGQLKKQLSAFCVDDLAGQLVDVLYPDASHQRDAMTAQQPFTAEFNVADIVFGLVASPWFDSDGNRLGTLIEWEDKTDARALADSLNRVAEENSRIRQALDVCDTSVMLADENLNIIYLNKAVQKMLEDRQATLREAIPNFDAKALMGVCVDDFHKSPSHQRSLLRQLKEIYKTELKIKDLTFSLMATPLFDDKGKRLGTVVEWQDKTESLAAQAKENILIEENARVRQALDSVTTNVMIAEDNATIIYMNAAVQEMMSNAEQDLRTEIKDFKANQLMGKSMDVFHKNPAHQQKLIQQLKTTYQGKAEVGGRHFSITATPIVTLGKRIGTVVEWSDKTAEINIEREIDKVLEAAMMGDFTRQVNMDGKSGFFADLSKGLNTLVSTVEVSLNDVLRVLGAMAKGDLSERITREYSGTFGQLKNDANTTVEKLTEVIGRIRSSSEAITTGANEIAQGNDDLSQRTEQQASSLEETAASMEQMTAAVRQSASNAQDANKFSDEARDKARSGGEVVAKAIQAMEDINTASKKISDIIGLIDEIAFQTNLLALNAAVEAARAGEQGRGFAVVAGEVRSLAQRSAGAAKQIKDLIRDSVGKVQDGQALVNASGETLSEIVRSVEQVGVMIRDIAGAAMEQTSGIEQVNAAIAQMDEMTQQNAALVEQASAAGQTMADQARDMNSVVEFFSLETARRLPLSFNSKSHLSPSSASSISPLTKASATPQKSPVHSVANTAENKQAIAKNKTTPAVVKKTTVNKVVPNKTLVNSKPVNNTSVTNKSANNTAATKTLAAKPKRPTLVDDEWEEF